MKKFKTKFATVMLVVSCAFAGVGATNLVFSDAYNAGITANAETTYTEYNVSDLTVFRWLIFKLCCCQRGRRDFHRRYVCE